MVKSYVFNIENCIYNVNISDNIAIITDSNNNKICDNIEIADIYIDNEEIIKAIVECHIECNNKIAQAEQSIEEAMKILGIK